MPSRRIKAHPLLLSALVLATNALGACVAVEDAPGMIGGTGARGPSPAASDEGSSGDDTAGDANQDAIDGASSGFAGEDASDTDAFGGTSGGEMDATTGDPWEDPDPDEPAQGLDVVALDLNQGVTTTLGKDGEVWSVAEHEAHVVHSRTTLVRAHVDVEDGFVPRMILAKLRVRLGNGAVTTFEKLKYISADSHANSPGSAIAWELPPGSVKPGIKLAVELYEPTPTGLSQAQTAPRFPSSGYADAGVTPTNQVLRLVFVPYRHKYGACDKTAPHDDALVDAYRREAMQQLPVQDVEITVHEPVVFTDSMADLVDVLDHVTALRAAEAPSPDVFYFAAVNPCGGTNAGGVGWVLSSPSAAGSAQYRASVGVYYSWAEDYSHNAMVHELGHNFGRRHVACSGSEGKTDSHYPHEGGVIASWGWGVEDGTWKAPSTPETMSYCIDGEQWQSDYGWSWSYEVLSALYAHREDAEPQMRWALRIIRRADGSMTSRLVAVALEDARPTDIYAVTARGRTRLLGQRLEISHSDAEVYDVALTNDTLKGLQRVEWHRGGKALQVRATQIRDITRLAHP